MTDAGYEAKVDPASRNDIVARNCVFHRSAERFPAICKFDLAFLEGMTGERPQHVECMVRGGQCCRFRFRKAKG
jgi:predicted ArsR family transcriptional regulator